MKRASTNKTSVAADATTDTPIIIENPKKMLKTNTREHQTTEATYNTRLLNDENMLYEVLKHADAKTLARAACVNKKWKKTAQDERLWELICTKKGGNVVGCGNQQLRSVVLALGGFRRLHSSLRPPFVPVVAARGSGKKMKWGKDEVQLSLSLMSVRQYEKIKFGER